MALPVLTYGAMIWGHVINTRTHKENLRRLNRLACNTIAGVRRSNPTRALEIIYDLPPLHLVIMRAGLRSYARLQGQLDRKLAGITSNSIKRNSHKMYWEKLASEANIELKNSDVICETIREKRFRVNLESFDGKMKHLRMSEYNVYTDGSRIDGQCGAGYSIYKYKTNIASNCANLPTTSTVFQAEIIGIKLACEELTKMQGERNIKYVKIFSDSQAAVAALDPSEMTAAH